MLHELTDREYKALISMPEFQDSLRRMKRAEERAEAERIRDIGRCEGAAPIADADLTLRCPKCGLTLKHERQDNLYTNHLILMRQEHWNRPDKPQANPFTSNGMYGKAAGGDWYMDH